MKKAHINASGPLLITTVIIRFKNLYKIQSILFFKAAAIGLCVQPTMGEPETHIYTYTFPNGESKSHCGAYVLEIPSITVKDMGEIKKLIKEEHEYLLKHEASIK